MDDLDSMTGLQTGGGVKITLNLLQLNADAEIQEINGEYKTKGGFFRKMIMVGKAKEDRPAIEVLGEAVDVVILKVRRRLEQRSKSGEVVLRTSEHSTKDDVVELYDDKNKVIATGRASALREKFEGLKTIQVVYSLLLSSAGTKEPELVKLIVKGASLGSENRDPELPSFYDYISADRKDSEDNKIHLRQYVTHLGLVKEVGAKTYFTMTFTLGEKLPPELQAVSDTTLRDIHGKLVQQDGATKERIASAKTAAPADGTGSVVPDAPSAQVADDDIQYPGGDEINPEDIPF